MLTRTIHNLKMKGNNLVIHTNIFLQNYLELLTNYINRDLYTNFSKSSVTVEDIVVQLLINSSGDENVCVVIDDKKFNVHDILKEELMFYVEKPFGEIIKIDDFEGSMFEGTLKFLSRKHTFDTSMFFQSDEKTGLMPREIICHYIVRDKLYGLYALKIVDAYEFNCIYSRINTLVDAWLGELANKLDTLDDANGKEDVKVNLELLKRIRDLLLEEENTYVDVRKTIFNI